MTFDSVTRKKMAEELIEAAKKIAKKYGFEAKLSGGTYDDVVYRPKVEFFNVATKKLVAQSYAGLMGLPENIIGKSFVSKTKTFTITGINPNRPKNCIEMVDQNGTAYKCSKDNLRAHGLI